MIDQAKAGGTGLHAGEQPDQAGFQGIGAAALAAGQDIETLALLLVVGGF